MRERSSPAPTATTTPATAPAAVPTPTPAHPSAPTATKAAATDAATPSSPAAPPAAAAPSRREEPSPPQPRPTLHELDDIIPADVESSFGGSTGDLWEDAYPAAAAAPIAPQGDGEAVEIFPTQAPPEAAAAPRRPATTGRSPAAATAALLGSDTPEGKAFAQLVELFPGQVVEVRPLAQEADEGAEDGDATEAGFGSGYDDATGAEPDAEDA